MNRLEGSRELSREARTADFARYRDFFQLQPAGLEFAVPLIPPSVNHYKVRRFYNSPEASAFIEAVCIFSRKVHVVAPFYEVETFFFVPPTEFLRWDVDNFSKVAIDSLARAGVVKDDRYMADHLNHKRRALTERDAHTLYIVKGREAV